MESKDTSTPAVPPAPFKSPTTHRTNSLGWAKSDCHTCQSASRNCDRTRPRCNACTARGTTCSGYVLKLQWQNRGRKARSLKAIYSPFTRAGKSKASSPVGLGTPAKIVDYTFVQENGRRTRSREKLCVPSEPTSQENPEERSLPTTHTESAIERRYSTVGSVPILVLYSRQPEYFQLPSSCLEQVAFFRWTFSSVTLTYDIKANPWQACITQIDRAPFLLDAIQALSIRHRSHLEGAEESLMVLEFKDKALSAFSQSIGKVPLEVGISASLMLIGIDYADSGFGKWTVHLQGVHRMIEAAGGIQRGNGDMQLRAQIAQLVWYDTVIALLSRRYTVFPREYIEQVVSWKNESQWSLFALNGFPDSAFLDMYDIAGAAAHASSLPDGYVASLEMKLWLGRFETEQASGDKDIPALMDCWRLGLLLYCTRVFHRGVAARRKARLLAEEIMWLVHEFPSDSNKQKQALLPLFLAASEIESFRFRRIATEFCERWKKKSGIWLNQTALDLLQTVWAAVDANPDDDIWWGDFINPALDSGFLFG